MTLKRGDVVLIDLGYASGTGSKLRPALVVQNDRDNQRLLNTIVAQFTTVTHRHPEPTQLLVQINTPEGKQSGLKFDSAVNCVNLFTVEQTRILRVIGTLPANVMHQVNDCLKAALEIP